MCLFYDWPFFARKFIIFHLNSCLSFQRLCRLYVDCINAAFTIIRRQVCVCVCVLCAGHDDIVNFLLRRFHRLRVDQCNKLGFTALMKAAIQGRTRCAKLLLFAGMYDNHHIINKYSNCVYLYNLVQIYQPSQALRSSSQQLQTSPITMHINT